MGLGYGWKILILCGFIKNPVYKGGHEKLIYRRELPKKGGETWQKRGWGVFEGGEGGGRWYPNAHYELGNNFNCDFSLLMPMSSLLISNKEKYYLAIDWLLIITFNVVRR